MNNQEALYKTNLSFIKQVLIVQLQPWKGSSDLAVASSHAGRFLAGSLPCWGCTEGWAAELQSAKAWTNQARGEERVRAVETGEQPRELSSAWLWFVGLVLGRALVH